MKNGGKKISKHKKSNIYINTNICQNIKKDIKTEPYNIDFPKSYINTNIYYKYNRQENSKNSSNNNTECNIDNYYSLRNNNSFLKPINTKKITNYLPLPQPKKTNKKKMINKITYKIPEKFLTEAGIICDKYNYIYFPNNTDYNNNSYNNNVRNSDNINNSHNNIHNMNNIYNHYMNNIPNVFSSNNINNRIINTINININNSSNSLNMINNYYQNNNSVINNSNINNSNTNISMHSRRKTFTQSSLRPKSLLDLRSNIEKKQKNSNDCHPFCHSRILSDIGYGYGYGYNNIKYYNENSKENNLNNLSQNNSNIHNNNNRKYEKSLNYIIKENFKKNYEITKINKKESNNIKRNKSSNFRIITKSNNDLPVGNIIISNFKNRSLTSNDKNNKYSNKIIPNNRNILQKSSLKNNLVYHSTSKTLDFKNQIQIPNRNDNIKSLPTNERYKYKYIDTTLNKNFKIEINNGKKLIKKNIINIVLKNKKQTIQKIINRRKSISINLLSKMIKKKCDICHKFIDSHLFKIHYNSHPSKIFDWLYLGSFFNACDIKELKFNGINNILNCAIECHNTKLPDDIQELHLNIKDLENFDIINYFEEANEYINYCKLEGNTLLVHCKFGISRSASFIIAYLIKYSKLAVDDALKFVKEKRSKIKPNKGFINQLYEYEKWLNEKKN